VLLPRRRPLVLGARFSPARGRRDANLPPDFKKIPLEHEAIPRSGIGARYTIKRRKAVLLAQIPQTARVSKKS
jgi:hypothetical protein